MECRSPVFIHASHELDPGKSFWWRCKSAKGSKTPPISLVSVEHCGLWTLLYSSDLGICIQRKLVCCGHMTAYHCSRYFTDSTLMTANARNSRVIVV